MEVYKQILTKNEINVRFIMAINAILDKKMVNSKVDLAESLNVKQFFSLLLPLSV